MFVSLPMASWLQKLQSKISICKNEDVAKQVIPTCPITCVFFSLSVSFHQKHQFHFSHHSFLDNILDLIDDGVRSVIIIFYI